MSDWTSAPIKSTIEMIDTNLSDAVSTAASGISGAIMPLVATCFGIYIILITVNLMRGASSSPVWDIWQRVLGFAVVIGIGLNASNYADYVLPIVKGFGDDIASAAIHSDARAEDSLDALANHYIKIISEDYKRISDLGILSGTDKFTEPILWAVKTFVIMLGLVPFLVAAAALLIIAKVGVMLVAAVGPIFFACLIFPATRQYFSSWLNAAVSYALVPLFVAIIAGFSVQISTEIFVPGIDGFERMSFSTCILAAIVNLLLIILLKTAQALASQLSSGGINIGFNSSAAASGAARGIGSLMSKGAGGIGKAAKATFQKVASAVQNMRNNGIRPG